MRDAHDHQHLDQHGHAGGHASLWLAAGGHERGVHRVGRRQFLTDLGRNTFAIAVLGGFVAACADSGDDAPKAVGSEAASPVSTNAGTVTSTAAPSPSPTSALNSPSTSTGDAGRVPDLQWAQARLGSVSAYVLVRGNEAAVVDTGSSGSAEQIGEALATLGANFDDIRHVVLTHSHPDHIGSLPAVLERASAAEAYAGEADIPNITSPIGLRAVGDGDDVFGLQVIHTPGHTPGSISVFDPGIGLLLAGDALNGNEDGTGLSGANERFTPDMASANASVGALATLQVEAVGMGHGQPVPSGAGPLLQALAAGL